MKNAAFDFDGVLNEYHGWKGEGVFGEPIVKGVELLRRAKDKGYRIVIFTARSEIKKIEGWFKEHDIPFDEVTNTKPPADFYVDDRAVHFSEERTVDMMWVEMVAIADKREEEKETQNSNVEPRRYSTKARTFAGIRPPSGRRRDYFEGPKRPSPLAHHP